MAVSGLEIKSADFAHYIYIYTYVINSHRSPKSLDFLQYAQCSVPIQILIIFLEAGVCF